MFSQQTTFGRNTMSSSQELDRVQERADKTTAELRRTQAELRVTQVSANTCRFFSRTFFRFNYRISFLKKARKNTNSNKFFIIIFNQFYEPFFLPKELFFSFDFNKFLLLGSNRKLTRFCK